MKQIFQNLPIKYKFFGTIAGLIIGIAAFMLLYFPKNLTELKIQGLITESVTMSTLMSFSLVGGVEFEDEKTATDVFQNATSNKRLQYAVIYKPDGSTFAAHNEDSAKTVKRNVESKTGLHFFQEDLLHVITPIESGGDVIAYLMTGFSMADIEAARRENLQTILLISSLITIVGLAFAIVVGTMVTRPIHRVIAASQNVAAGDLSQDIPVGSKDETGILAKNFNFMVSAIRKSDSNMRSLLAGLSQGIFFFDRNGQIAKERSPALRTILPDSDQFVTIHDFFAAYGGISNDSVKLVLGCLWDDSGFMSPFDGTVAMLGTSFDYLRSDGVRNLKFDYKELFDDKGALDKVIVFVTDATEQLAAERAQKAQSERIKRISMAAADQESFREFFADCLKVLKSAETRFASNTTDVAALKRDLHTIKGNVATYEFQSLASDIHHIEDHIASANITEAKRLWQHAKDRWKFETTDIQEVLGLNKSENYMRVDRSKFEQLKDAVKTGNASNVTAAVENIQRYPATDVMGKYARLSEALARKLDKSVQVDFARDCSEVSYAEIQLLDGALVHLFRNCVDHGIEPLEKRRELGKREVGSISVGVFRKNNTLHIMLKDDGKGIDAEKLAAKAVAMGHWTKDKAAKASRDEKVRLIFLASLSTAETVTETSGRGVGMDAVQDIITKLAGTISVHSEVGIGTQFKIELPLDKVQATAKAA